MRTTLYRLDKCNKYIEVRRYSDGHYAFRAFLTFFIPKFGRCYLGCDNRMKGKWHRCRKAFLDDVLQLGSPRGYSEVSEAVFIKLDGTVVKEGGDVTC